MSYEDFKNAYVECLLWTSYTAHEDGEPESEPLDGMFSFEDFTPEAQKEIEDDCRGFYDAFSAVIDDDSQAGQDFCLTRNRHGAGFWDGDWPEPLATTLTDASHAYGTQQAVRWGDDAETVDIHS